MTTITHAQNEAGQGAGSAMWIFLISLLVIVALLVGDSLVRAQASMSGVDMKRDDSAFFPGLAAKFKGGRAPDYVGEGESYHDLKRGHNINLEGGVTPTVKDVTVHTFAVQPPDFRGIRPIPKVMVKKGDDVAAGDPLFYDKSDESILYTAPVSGEIADIRRGAKRSITEVVILADKDQRFKELPSIDPDTADRQEIIQFMKSSGFWPCINQRPFDIVADPSENPRDIFITTFDTAPLAPDMNFIIDGKEAAFQKGLDVLNQLTSGNVHLGLDARDERPHIAYAQAKGVEKHWFSGPHPAGNVGIQIHRIAPIKPGDIVWTLQVEDVVLLGDMVLNRRFNPEVTVAITGEGAREHIYLRTRRGAHIADLLRGQDIDEEQMRIISGDVLSGTKTPLDGFLHWRDNQITVIPEGKDYEMFGWLIPAIDRPTLSHTYPNFLFNGMKYNVDTNTHGERRAFVQTGQYESVLPANIYPQHLMKAILTENFEKMEGLGLLELSEEDIALCEFACTSKQPLQEILREGLDYMQEQG